MIKIFNPQRTPSWSPLFQNYHSHFIIQKKKKKPLINVINFLANHSSPFPSFKTSFKITKTLVPRVFYARNERPLSPIDSCRSGSRGTSRESWKLLYPCVHARATPFSARVVNFFSPTKPLSFSLRVSSKMINFSTRRLWRWPGRITLENGFSITRVCARYRVVKSSYRAVWMSARLRSMGHEMALNGKSSIVIEYLGVFDVRRSRWKRAFLRFHTVSQYF